MVLCRDWGEEGHGSPYVVAIHTSGGRWMENTYKMNGKEHKSCIWVDTEQLKKKKVTSWKNLVK